MTNKKLTLKGLKYNPAMLTSASNIGHSKNCFSHSTASPNEEIINRSSKRNNHQQNIQLFGQSSQRKLYATTDQEVCGSVSNKIDIFLPSRRQDSEPVYGCANGTPQQPVAIFPVGLIPNCQLNQNQHLHDAQC